MKVRDALNRFSPARLRRVAAGWLWWLTVRWMQAMPKAGLRFLRLQSLFLPQHLDVFAVAGGLGDELMAWGVVSDYAKQKPNATVTYHSRFHYLLEPQSSNLKVVPHHGPSLPPRAVGLGYASKTPLSINEQFATRLGIRPREYDIPLNRFPAATNTASALDSDHTVVIQPMASKWTVNKQWSEESWRALVEGLPANFTIIEVGQQTLFAISPRHPGFRSLAGETTVQEYLGLVSGASLFIGPPSSGMHVAHAYSVPSVIIVGGYEAPAYPYPAATQLHTPMPCSPCWLCTDCPHDKACLRSITPEQVLKAALLRLQGASVHTQLPA